MPGVVVIKEEKNRKVVEIKPINSKPAKALTLGSEILGRVQNQSQTSNKNLIQDYQD